MNDKHFLFATVARSFDQYHLKNKLIHLVSSVFHTQTDCTNEIFKSRSKDRHIIIRVTSDFPDTEFKFFKHNENTIEFTVSVILFSNYHGNLDFNNFLIDIIGSHFTTEKNIDNILNDVLFVFEDLSWSNVQLLFATLKIKISGGSTSRRQMLSPTEFMLSTYLIKMGYSHRAVFNTLGYSKQILEDSVSLEFDRELLIKAISAKYKGQEDYLQSAKNEVEQEIKNLTQKIKDLTLDPLPLATAASLEKNELPPAIGLRQPNLENSISSSSQRQGLAGVERASSLTGAALKYRQTLEKKEEKLSELNTQTKTLAEEKKYTLSKSFPLADLKKFYYDNFYNDAIIESKQTIRYLIREMKEKKVTGYSNYTGRRF